MFESITDMWINHWHSYQNRREFEVALNIHEKLWGVTIPFNLWAHKVLAMLNNLIIREFKSA